MKKKTASTRVRRWNYLILSKVKTMKNFRLKLFAGSLTILFLLSMIVMPAVSHAVMDGSYRTGDDPGTGTGEPASSGDDLFRGTDTGTGSTSDGSLTGGKDGLNLTLNGGYPEKALISGVPRYFQKDITCDQIKDRYGKYSVDGIECMRSEPFPSGCGPVAGASILAWWDRRGFDNLVNESDVDEDGLPQNLIMDLGRIKYMNRNTLGGKGESWVGPDHMQSGLEDFISDMGYDFTVTQYRITKDGVEKFGDLTSDSGVTLEHVVVETMNVDDLYEIVKEEITSGRPLIYLHNVGREQDSHGNYKSANHFAPVVGYDSSQGDYRLILQENHTNGAEGKYMTGYDNYYSDDVTPISLKDYAEGGLAGVNYHIYTIQPNESYDYSGKCEGLLLDQSKFHNVLYHETDRNVSEDYCATLDGHTSPAFEHDTVSWIDSSWGVTSRIMHQDRECFVAHWNDGDGDGLNDYDTGIWDSDGDRYADVCDYPELSVRMLGWEVTPYTSTIDKVTLTGVVYLDDSREEISGSITALLNIDATYFLGGIEDYLDTSMFKVNGFNYNSASKLKYLTFPSGYYRMGVRATWYVDNTLWDDVENRMCSEVSVSIIVDPYDDVEELREAEPDFSDVALYGTRNEETDTIASSSIYCPDESLTAESAHSDTTLIDQSKLALEAEEAAISSVTMDETPYTSAGFETRGDIIIWESDGDPAYSFFETEEFTTLVEMYDAGAISATDYQQELEARFDSYKANLDR
jgi:hypothetical protein